MCLDTLDIQGKWTEQIMVPGDDVVNTIVGTKTDEITT